MDRTPGPQQYQGRRLTGGPSGQAHERERSLKLGRAARIGRASAEGALALTTIILKA